MNNAPNANGVYAPSKELLAKWQGLTDDNCHNEVRMEICYFFNHTAASMNRGDHDALAIAYSFCDNLAKKEHLTVSDVNDRYELTNGVIDIIAKNFGTDIANQVNDCL